MIIRAIRVVMNFSHHHYLDSPVFFLNVILFPFAEPDLPKLQCTEAL